MPLLAALGVLAFCTGRAIAQTQTFTLEFNHVLGPEEHADSARMGNRVPGTTMPTS
jgi:hypothetical protein